MESEEVQKKVEEAWGRPSVYTQKDLEKIISLLVDRLWDIQTTLKFVSDVVVDLEEKVTKLEKKGDNNGQYNVFKS